MSLAATSRPAADRLRPGGNDYIEVAGGIGPMTWLYGGAGGDRLKGGAGVLLMGGDANDLPWAATVALIGGGARSDDHFSGGTSHRQPSMYDFDAVALNNIMAEWNSRRYAPSVAPRGTGTGPRLSSNTFLTNLTVLDDGVRDMMTGGSALDWFWAFGLDLITDDMDESSSAEPV